MGTGRKYSAEFKAEALELPSQPGQTVAGVTRDLGIRPYLIHRWRRELAEHGRQALNRGQTTVRTEEPMKCSVRSSHGAAWVCLVSSEMMIIVYTRLHVVEGSL